MTQTPPNGPINVKNFRFEQAFSRSIGLVTAEELQLLRTKRVAIAGMGGVGGSHLLTLTRLGIGAFHIADFDHFEIHNFNRQAGANLATLGQPKVNVMRDVAHLINPELQIVTFNQGVDRSNIEQFFKHVDVYVDALDYFAFQARRMVYDYCYKNGIPIVTAGPIAMGAALLVFMPNGIDPIKYFDWQPQDSEEVLAVKLLVGLTPAMPHRNQIVDESAVNFQEHRGPSLPMSCELCAGVVGVETLKILINRGTVLSAPHSIHFDAFTNRLHRRYIWLGNRNPWQRLKIYIGLKRFRR